MSDNKNAKQSAITDGEKSSGLSFHQEENQETISSKSQSDSSAQEDIEINVTHSKEEMTSKSEKTNEDKMGSDLSKLNEVGKDDALTGPQGNEMSSAASKSEKTELDGEGKKSEIKKDASSLKQSELAVPSQAIALSKMAG